MRLKLNVEQLRILKQSTERTVMSDCGKSGQVLLYTNVNSQFAVVESYL
jgi:hypothetical protein